MVQFGMWSLRPRRECRNHNDWQLGRLVPNHYVATPLPGFDTICRRRWVCDNRGPRRQEAVIEPYASGNAHASDALRLELLSPLVKRLMAVDRLVRGFG